MNREKWLDCGCCGRTHYDLPVDCRRFATCPNCGDCYPMEMLADHITFCTGNPASEDLDAEFAYGEDA